MKASYYPLLRIVLTLVTGIFMIVSPDSVLTYIAYIIGLLLIVPALIQLMRYALVRFQRNSGSAFMTFPILSLLCAISGLFIILFSHEIVKVFSLLLASGLLIAGIYEIVLIARSANRNTLGYYILPIILTLMGIFIISNPLDLLPHVIVIMFGIGAIIYSISEIIYLVRISRL